MIERLLSVDFPEVDYFRAQVPHLVVRNVCNCGCGTIDFAIDPKQAPRAPSPAWDGATGPIVEGDQQSWLMLMQADGYLTDLEHVAGCGLTPEQLDPDRIKPDLQVTDDWFANER